ncbi:MAG: acyl-CoA dehydrogenase [Pseudomonadota bacterium]
MAIFEPNDDQKLLSDSVARFIERSYDDAARIKMTGEEFNPERWASMAELGWLMLPFQEADGGMQAEGRTGAGDIATLYEAMGPGQIIEPILATSVLAGGLIAQATGPARNGDLIGEIAAGAARASAALHEPRTRFDLMHCETTAAQADGGWRLDGVKSMALGAPGADYLIILARAGGAPGDDGASVALFLVPADAPGVTLKPYRLRDDHWAADVTLKDVRLPESAVLSPAGEAAALVNLVVDQTRFAMAAELVGLAQRLTGDTVGYAGVRSQFGVPIGSFQVLQHRMVDMDVGVETARSLVYRAAGLAEEGWTDEARACARRAYAAASETAMTVAKHAVQIHGGMGMTEDVPVGRLFRRVYAIALMFSED